MALVSMFEKSPSGYQMVEDKKHRPPEGYRSRQEEAKEDGTALGLSERG